MPFKLKEIRKCKYCNSPAAKNILPSGRNKGYYRTCGNEKCLKIQYSDKNVCDRKRYKGNAVCIHCKNVFKANSGRQKYCFECAPTKSALRILNRYKISYIEYVEMLKKSPICEICLKRKSVVIDHCHKTNKVRGIICNHCNTSLHLIENKPALYRAIKYLNKVK